MGRIRAAWDALTRRDLAGDEIGWRLRGDRGPGGQRATPETSLRHSAVWACLRLRANLVSSLPVDVYTEAAGLQVEVQRPAVLERPESSRDVTDWMWATQYDLDRYGNTFGIITAVDSENRPAEIELVNAGDVSVRTSGRRITEYRIGQETYDPRFIWHEWQYRPAGSALGMSPIAYAAWSISGYLSAQQFALDWYSNGAAPSGVLRNTEKTEVKAIAAKAKAQFKEAVRDRDIFVTGRDWEWTPAQGDANSAAFLEQMRYGVSDVCRFFDVPGDMVDAPVSGSSVTYANVTQRFLQLLVTNLGPAVTRRERALSSLVSRRRFVKLNRNALLAMDPQTRSLVLTQQVAGRILTPNEARAIEDRPPFTEDDLAQFDRLFGVKNPPPQPLAAPTDQARWALPDARAEVVDVQTWREPLAIEGGAWAPPDPRRAGWQ